MPTPPPDRPREVDGRCDLCGLPLRLGLVGDHVQGRAYQFCCIGCRQVFTMLMEAADAPDPAQFRETELFKQCRELGIIPASTEDLASRSAERRSSAPAATLQAAAVGSAGADERLIDLNLTVDDMWCPACAWVIEQSLGRTPGITSVSCSFSTDRLRCAYDPLLTDPDQIVGRLRRLGYRAAPPGEALAAAEKRREMVRFCISALLTANVMMLSFALYSGFFSRLDPETIGKISWPIFLLASGVFFYGGWKVHRKAWSGLTSLAPGMETLVSIAAAAAYVYSTYNLLAGSIHLYFDTASMLITLVLLGKMLERQAKSRIQEDLGNFFSLRPTKARICTPEAPRGRYVAAEFLAPGDIFHVREAEIVPADGVVVEGAGRVDESSLTGEARPVGMKPGKALRSGSQVLSGEFKVRADAVGDASLLGQMIAIMERAVSGKTPLEGKTDRLLMGFVPLILLLAVGTGVFCLLRGAPIDTALVRCVTVLVIACPCALGIAIPLARVAGIAAAGKRGLVVRDFAAFEQARGLSSFVFDKTGTVTEGRWRLIRVRPIDSFSEDRLLALAAGLEGQSDHPVGALIRREAERRRITHPAVQHVVSRENGILGEVAGKTFKIGSEGFLAEEIRAVASENKGFQIGPGAADVSQVYMSCEGRLCGVFEFGDTLRPGTAAAIEWLKARAYRVALVSGDGDGTVRAVACRIGLSDARGGMLPADKAMFVADLQFRGEQVAMIGDGVNDAPALAQSDLGIAVHSGSHLGKEAADITLMRGDPGQIPDFIALAQTVNRTIHQNLWCAFGYNIVSIPIAMSGLLTPLVAVCAMLLSSLTVIGNTLRLARRPGASDRAVQQAAANEASTKV